MHSAVIISTMKNDDIISHLPRLNKSQCLSPASRAVLDILKISSLKTTTSGSEGKYLEVYIFTPNIITFYPFGPLGLGTVSVLLSVVLPTLSNLISMVTLSYRLKIL